VEFDATSAWVAMLFAIKFTFSGYTDMALAAQLLGYQLPVVSGFPISRDIAEVGNAGISA
jgi:hypothetical protein